MSREGVCIHGALRRQSETCDLAERLEKMTKERDALLRYAKAAANPNRDHNLLLSICPRNVYDEAWAEFRAAEAALRELGVKL